MNKTCPYLRVYVRRLLVASPLKPDIQTYMITYIASLRCHLISLPLRGKLKMLALFYNHLKLALYLQKCQKDNMRKHFIIVVSKSTCHDVADND